MSVRRLADDTVQPAKFAFSRDNTTVVKGWIKKYPKDRKASAVIPLLMIAQEQDGWVTKASIEHIAEMLEMPCSPPISMTVCLGRNGARCALQQIGPIPGPPPP